MTNAKLNRYLATHAEPLTSSYADKVGKKYTHVIVIPMYDEASNCLSQVFRHHAAVDTPIDKLIIAVVNAPDNAESGPLSRTRRLLREVSGPSSLDVLVVDCATKGLSLPAKQGVGLARKIGTDIALQLFVQDKIQNPWLYQTDADAVLPAGYFSTRLPVNGAVVFAHVHDTEDLRLARAADLYDMHMRYYVAGLAKAGSSYAYPTLGSTIAIHASAYAAVRGYPKRNAAEDFYLLNKVAKIANIAYQKKTVLMLRARLSKRVPFGTGPALADIYAGLETDPSGYFYLSYHPASFAMLADTLSYLDEFANTACPPPRNIGVILETLRFDKVRDAITTKYATTARRNEILHQWFDAGKTLRFIHQARRYHADQPLLQTLNSLPEELRNVIIQGSQRTAR